MRSLGLAMFFAILAAASCGGEGTQDDDDALTDDDAVLEDLDGDQIADISDSDIDGDGVPNVEDLDPRDPMVRRGTGTISVTYTMLAALDEGQIVEPEIVIGRVEDPELPPAQRCFMLQENHEDYTSHRCAADYTFTGILAPASIEVDIGTYVVGARVRSSDASTSNRFVSTPCELVVERGATAECAATVTRDLTGRWELVAFEGAPPPVEDYADASMFQMEQPEEWIAPCATRIWVGGMGGPLCLLEGDHVHSEQTDVEPLRIWDGMILDSGTRVEYTVDDDEGLRGPYRLQRLPD